jgi:hypothetical protein
MQFLKYCLYAFIAYSQEEKVLEKGRLQYLFVDRKGNQNMHKDKKSRKTTDEIRTLLKNAKLDFDEVENRALNDYLSKILHSCPFTEEICTTNQCQECSIFKKTLKQITNS